MKSVEGLTKADTILIKKVQKAAKKSAIAQKELLETGRVERSFSTNFRDEIKNRIGLKNIIVDSPYNRHGHDKKRIQKKLIELDIAIHERFTDSNNLVAIELETNNTPVGDDVWKIEELTKESGAYGYRLGLFIVFGVKDKAGTILKEDWYKNGKLIFSA